MSICDFIICYDVPNLGDIYASFTGLAGDFKKDIFYRSLGFCPSLTCASVETKQLNTKFGLLKVTKKCKEQKILVSLHVVLYHIVNTHNLALETL